MTFPAMSRAWHWTRPAGTCPATGAGRGRTWLSSSAERCRPSGDALDPGDGALEGGLVEQVRRRVRELVRRPVELVRPIGGIDRVPQWDLVGHDEDPLLRPLEHPAVSLGVATRRVVERLAAGKLVAPYVLPLPRAVVAERLPLQLADLDVVEQRLLEERNVAALERDLRRLDRSREARVHAQVERQVGQLLPQEPRLVAPLLSQRDRHRGIPVHALLEVERRLPVPRDHEQPHVAEPTASL